MPTLAQDTLIPKEPGIFRAAFLYAGQGDTTFLAIPDGRKYLFALVDSNNDAKTQGMDVLKLLHDLLDKPKRKLDLYINTHPHADHVRDVDRIYNEIGIEELWHSAHVPAEEKHQAPFEKLVCVINSLGKDRAFVMSGSRSRNRIHRLTKKFPCRITKENEKKIMSHVEKKLGEIDYHVLAPASYVFHDHALPGAKGNGNYQEIHEHCAVIKFICGGYAVLVTGDADFSAWHDHITKYHLNDLSSMVVKASHHGSNNFFWETSKPTGDPYDRHIKSINPEHVIVSAPTRDESKRYYGYGHPHAEAMRLYKKDGKTVYHLGAEKTKRMCVVVDLKNDGKEPKVRVDYNLAKTYRAT